MSETDLALPAGFRFFKVLCNFGVIRPDGADPDRFPDFRTQGGQVMIVANAPRIRHLAITGAGRMVNLPEEIFTVQPSTGTLLDAQGEALYLLDPLSDDIDPRGFTYTATVKSATDLTPWTVTFGGDVQLPAEVDLVRLASIAPSTGTASLEQRVAALEASAGTGGSGPAFTEATQDVVGAMIVAAGGTYDDGAGTITLPASGGGGASTITVDNTPAAPAEGESASYLVELGVTWPDGLVWSLDPDAGVAPVVTGPTLVSMFTTAGKTYAMTAALWPAADVTEPEPGALAASQVTSTTLVLTIVGASDSESGLDPSPYRFTRDGTAITGWQASPTLSVSGLTAGGTYTYGFEVRDKVGNVAEGTPISVTTEPPIDPSTIAGLDLWLKADAIEGLAEDDDVTEWPDSSAAGNDAVVVYGYPAPTYRENVAGTLPGVDFQYSRMTSPTSTSGPEQTIFAVVILDAPADQPLMGTSGSGGVTLKTYIDGRPTVTLPGVVDALHGTTPIVTGTPTCVSSIYSEGSTSVAVRLNGGANGSKANHTAKAAPGTTACIGYSPTTNPMWILDGRVLELLHYSDSLTTEQARAVEEYLCLKYGIPLS